MWWRDAGELLIHRLLFPWVRAALFAQEPFAIGINHDGHREASSMSKSKSLGSDPHCLSRPGRIITGAVHPSNTVPAAYCVINRVGMHV